MEPGYADREKRIGAVASSISELPIRISHRPNTDPQSAVAVGKRQLGQWPIGEIDRIRLGGLVVAIIINPMNHEISKTSTQIRDKWAEFANYAWNSLAETNHLTVRVGPWKLVIRTEEGRVIPWDAVRALGKWIRQSWILHVSAGSYFLQLFYMSGSVRLASVATASIWFILVLSPRPTTNGTGSNI